MKIIRISANDFVKAETDEWGFDYVEALFAEGLEPTLVNGVWLWRKPLVIGIGNAIGSTNTSGTMASAPISRSSSLSY